MKSISAVLVSDSNLGGENLQHLTANGSTFESVDFGRANLNGVRWRECTLKQVSLDAANASSAVMRLCAFVDVSATQASFEAAILENCKAHGCNFSHANFAGASLSDSDFSRSTFEGANLTDTDATYCNLRGVDFSSAVLVNTCFCDADLRGADFSGAVIDNADFRDADLRGAQFDDAVQKQLFPEPDNSNPPADLVNAVTPLVAGMLKQAANQGILDEKSWQSELDKTLRDMGAAPFNLEQAAAWDTEVGHWLRKAGDIGVETLLDALRSEGDQTPEAVAGMLEDLTLQLGLEPGVSTEELLSTLLAKLRQS